ncbi:MAG: cohesin domain-containing protein [Caldilineaceae bacterium]
MHKLKFTIGTFFIGLTLLIATVLSVQAKIGVSSLAASTDLAENGSTLAQRFGDNDIGVIPGPEGCARGYDTVEIYMDDEDDDNKNGLSGWTGAIQQDRNTLWVFCRVDGSEFFPWGSDDFDSVFENNYAVLKLSDACPNGSLDFARYFDNEDTRNKNVVTRSPVWPNEWVSNVRLHFCVFFGDYYGTYDGPNGLMTSFPELPFEYGVFAPLGLAASMENGVIHTDDEDDDNNNSYSYDANMSSFQRGLVHQIIAGSDNTDLRTAKVHFPSNDPTQPDYDTCGNAGYCLAHPRLIDVEISITTTVSTAGRAKYAEAISHFADAVYEQSNGMHKLHRVYVYDKGERSKEVDIIWGGKSGRSNATPSGYHFGGQVRLVEKSTVTETGYTLGHEWGHYYYGLKDEYQECCKTEKNKQQGQPHTDDDEVFPSIMNSQKYAIPAGPGLVWSWQNNPATSAVTLTDWLNFSSGGAITFTIKNAQYRTFEATAWETLVRPNSDDPKDPRDNTKYCIEYRTSAKIFCKKWYQDQRGPKPRQYRFYFPELANVQPASGQLPSLEIITTAGITQARSSLQVIWRTSSSSASSSSGGITLIKRDDNQTEIVQKKPFHVDEDLESIDVTIGHSGGTDNQIEVIVRDPEGTAYSQKNCTSTGNKETQCTITINNPTKGRWEIEISVEKPPLETQIIVIGHPSPSVPIALEAFIGVAYGNVVRYPFPAAVVAEVRGDLPITKVGLDAYIRRPDGSQSALVLKDDGIAPDAVADDGKYTGYLLYDQNGEYYIHAAFDNNAGTALYTSLGLEDGDGIFPVNRNFQRTASATITVLGVKTDDHGNTPAAATDLPTDNLETPGRIDYVQDLDLFRVTAEANGMLVVRIVGLGPGMQPKMKVYASDGTTLLQEISNTPTATSYPFAKVDANAGDIFYVEVSHADVNATTGAYFVSAGTTVASDTEPQPIVDLSLDTLTFTATAGGSNPAAQSLTIDNAGAGALSWTATEAIPWLSLSSMSGTAPATINVMIDISGLNEGSYSGEIQVTDGTNTATVAVALVVQQPTQPTTLQLDVDSGNKSMELSWRVTNDPHVVNYRISRSVNNGQNMQVIASNVTNTTYFDTDDDAGNDLLEGTTYCYRVEALRANGDVSATSNIGCGLFGILDVWVPDTVGKPGETVIVPINIRNADGLRVAASDVWLDFNPQVIESLSISRTALTASYAWAHSVQAIDANTSRVRIAYIHSDLNNPPPAMHGDGSLFWLTFRVLGQAGNSSSLNLKEFITAVGGSNIQNEALGDITLNLTDGVFTIAGSNNAQYILGDVDADTVVRARDAALALRLANGERPATQMETLAGDINGNGQIDAPDSTMILYFAGTGKWPSVPNTNIAVAAVNAPALEATVQLDDVQGEPGKTVQTMLRLSGAQAMAGGSFIIVYDPAVVSSIDQVTKGTLVADFEQLEYHDDGNGILQIALAHNGEVTGDGVLATIDLTLASSALEGVSTLRLADAKLNNLNGRDFVTGSAGNTLSRASAQVTINKSNLELGLSTNQLSFAATEGGSNPGQQTLTITLSDAQSAWSATSNQPWLTVAPSSGTGSGTVTVSVAAAQMAAQTYTGVIQISAGNQSRTVLVNLTVSPENSRIEKSVYLPLISR